MKNHYQTLGLKNDASASEIKKSYRFYASKFHPDKHGGDQFFEEKFKEIKDAYDVLSDLSKKSEYDATLTKSNPQSFRSSSAFDYESFEREENRLTKEREQRIYLKEGNLIINGNSVVVGKQTTSIKGYERAFSVIESKKKLRIIGWILILSSAITILILIGFVTLVVGLFLIFKRDIYYICIVKELDNQVITHTTDKNLAGRMVSAINESISNYKTAVNTIYGV